MVVAETVSSHKTYRCLVETGNKPQASCSLYSEIWSCKCIGKHMTCDTECMHVCARVDACRSVYSIFYGQRVWFVLCMWSLLYECGKIRDWENETDFVTLFYADYSLILRKSRQCLAVFWCLLPPHVCSFRSWVSGRNLIFHRAFKLLWSWWVNLCSQPAQTQSTSGT